jgi:hypothetical protein
MDMLVFVGMIMLLFLVRSMPVFVFMRISWMHVLMVMAFLAVCMGMFVSYLGMRMPVFMFLLIFMLVFVFRSCSRMLMFHINTSLPSLILASSNKKTTGLLASVRSDLRGQFITSIISLNFQAVNILSQVFLSQVCYLPLNLFNTCGRVGVGLTALERVVIGQNITKKRA